MEVMDSSHLQQDNQHKIWQIAKYNSLQIQVIMQLLEGKTKSKICFPIRVGLVISWDKLMGISPLPNPDWLFTTKKARSSQRSKLSYFKSTQQRVIYLCTFLVNNHIPKQLHLPALKGCAGHLLQKNKSRIGGSIIVIEKGEIERPYLIIIFKVNQHYFVHQLRVRWEYNRMPRMCTKSQVSSSVISARYRKVRFVGEMYRK